MLHAWSLPSRAIDFIKSCFKGECDTSIFKAGQSDSLYTVIPCTSDTLPTLQNNTEEAHTNFSKAVFSAWDELFDSSSDQPHQQWFANEEDLQSYLNTSTDSKKSSLPGDAIFVDKEEVVVDSQESASSNEAQAFDKIPQKSKSRPQRPKRVELPQDEVEIKPYFKITEKQIRAGLTLGNTKFGDCNAYFVFEGAEDFLSELGNRLISHDRADEGKVTICGVKHKYKLESVGGHYKTYKLTLTNTETGVKSHKYARLKDFDIRSRNNRPILQETFEVGTQRAIEKMYPQFYEDRARLIIKLKIANETQKMDDLSLFVNRFYDKYKAIPNVMGFISDIQEKIERTRTNPRPQVENPTNKPKSEKKQSPRMKSHGKKKSMVMGAFIACAAPDNIDNNDLQLIIERHPNDRLSEAIEQLNSVYADIFRKMQLATERYQNDEITEEEYINLSKECEADDDQFIIVADNIEANDLLDEEVRKALNNKKAVLFIRHDSVLKNIISKKLDKIATQVNETSRNSGDLQLLFHDIEQAWKALDQKNESSNLMLRKAELALQLGEYNIAADSYIAVLNTIDSEDDEMYTEHLHTLISVCEQLRDGVELNADSKTLHETIIAERDIISEISRKLADKKEEYRTTLENLSFIQLGIDLTIKLLEKYERQKAKDTPKEALAEPYIEVIHSVSSVTNQVIGVAKHHIGDSLRQLDSPTFDMIKSLLGDMTPEEEILVRDLFNPELNNEAAKANYRDYFKKHGGTILYFKLAVATFELGIKSCYAVYFQRNSREEASPALSYEQWVSGNIWTSVTSLLSRAKVVSDALSQAQILNQLYSLISTGNISLNSVRDMFVSMMIFPHLSHYINEFTCLPGEKISTNEYAVFALSLLENMNEGIFQQILNTHDETSLNLVVRVLRRFERSSGAASWLYGQTMPILNGIFYARLTYHSYHASLQVYDRSLENRLENIRAYLQILESPELKHPTQQKDIKCHTALLYESIKYTAYSLSNTHPIRCNLYIIALYKQHQLNTSFEIATINNVTSDPIFQAISWYTDESPQELYQLIVSNSKKICADHSIESDNYPEAEMINILSEILGRPICVVEGIASTNFFSSDFPKWDVDNFKILRGDPIFIFYDTDRKRYHGLLARGELYVEQQLKKKFTSREHVIESSISFSTAPGTLQSRLSRLRDGMFRTGLAVAPVGTVSAQNTGVNQGSAQKSSTLKSGAF